ncbi:MAG TPA: hypothetical protein VGR09_07200 [Gemmatimonadales bacterium]|nr:hypothetical protein [Gemmatimonadales bacterium]
MARVYAPEPLPGLIELGLVGKTPLERMVARAAEHNKLQPGAAFTLDGIQVQLLSPIALIANGTGIQMALRARVVATGEFLPMDPDGYGWINPPVKVPNGTWRVEPDLTERENFEENPLEAFKRIVLNSVLFYARHHGWAG